MSRYPVFSVGKLSAFLFLGFAGIVTVLLSGCGGTAPKEQTSTAVPEDMKTIEKVSFSTSEAVQSKLSPDSPLQVRWAMNLNGAQVSRMWMPPAELDYDYILVLTKQNELLALHKRNGKPLWSTKVNNDLTGDPFFSPYGVYFVVQSYLNAIERHSGEPIWRVKLPFPPSAGPVVHEDAEKLPTAFVPGLDRKVYAIEVEMATWPPKVGHRGLTREDFTYQKEICRIIWRYPAHGGIAGNLAISGRTIFLADNTNKAYSITTTQLTFGKPEEVEMVRTQGPMTAGPAVIGPYIAVASRDKNLYCYHLRDMTVNWHYAAGNILTQPAYYITDENTNRTTVVILCGSTGPLAGINDTDGKVAWEIKNADKIVAKVIETENEADKKGTMLILNKDKTISGHYIINGEKIWSTSMKGFDSVMQNTSNEYVYATTNGGSVVCGLIKRQ
ncbi:MAG: PQQ-binding-like beta-propeller repeat protein [Planctomycetes bacterium]|nr:PQQ-binding-like beta-propeller repeat protein [Planctomycetota bacterium]